MKNIIAANSAQIPITPQVSADPEANHSEKQLTFWPAIATQNPTLSSENLSLNSAESRFQETIDKQIERIHCSVQCALEKQIADLSVQFEQSEIRWKSDFKHERREREALSKSLSTSVGRDTKAIEEVVCNDLTRMRAQQQTALKDLSVQLETLLEQSEQRQVERINETGKQFAEVVDLHERKLADLEAAMQVTEANSTMSHSAVTIVLARVNELEKTLGDTVDRAVDGMQPKINTVIAHVDDISREVSTCSEHAKQLESEFNSRIAALQDHTGQQLDVIRQCAMARVCDIESLMNVSSQAMAQKHAEQAQSIVCLENNAHSLKDMTTMCKQEAEDRAAQMWHELEEHSQGLAELSSRLNAAVSRLGCQISGQEEELSNLVRAVSSLDIIGGNGDQMKVLKCDGLSGRSLTASLGQSFLSDSWSSIAPPSSDGRSCSTTEFTTSSSLGHLRTNFTTSSPTRNASAPECWIGELSRHDQDRPVKVCPKEGGSPHEEKDMSMNVCCCCQVGRISEAEYTSAKEGGDEEEKQDENNKLEKPFVLSSEDIERHNLVDLVKLSLTGEEKADENNKLEELVDLVRRSLGSEGDAVLGSARRERGKSSQSRTSNALARFRDTTNPDVDHGNIENIEVCIDLMRKSWRT